MASQPENTNPPLRLLAAFQQAFPDHTPAHILKVPGREMWIAAAHSPNPTYILHVPDLAGRVVFNRRSARTKHTVMNRPLPRWARYPAGVILALCDAGLDLNGLHAVIVGEEAQGPRYEHALGMVTAALGYTLNNLDYTTQSLLEVVERVRRDYLGT